MAYDHETVILLTKDLISRRSYSGEEQAAGEVLQTFFKEQGFDEVRVDPYGNVIGSVYGKKPGPGILFDGHMDTVPADERLWTKDPFGGEIEDGKLYGRGASDMKGALAAMASAGARFIREHGHDFSGAFHIAGVVHEEIFEGVAARSVSEIVRPDIVIIGEASELNLKYGQRGRAEIRVETKGVSVHSANPEKGVNAVYQMVKLIAALKTIVPPEYPGLGRGIMELTDIRSEPYPGASVLPSRCTATYDRRLLPGETKESVLAPVQQVIDELKAADPTFEATASFAAAEEPCYTGNTIRGERFFPGWIMDPALPLVQRVKGEMEAAGLHPALTVYNFCTNGSHYAGEAGIPTLGYGPSRENLAHTADEYVLLSDLYTAEQGYGCILKALLQP